MLVALRWNDAIESEYIVPPAYDAKSSNQQIYWEAAASAFHRGVWKMFAALDEPMLEHEMTLHHCSHH